MNNEPDINFRKAPKAGCTVTSPVFTDEDVMDAVFNDFIPVEGLHNMTLANLTARIHALNVRAGWWSQLDDLCKPRERNVFEMLALCHSELSEALEGHRKGLQDDKLPNRPMIEVELADTMIRVMDLAAGMDLDLAGAVYEKLIYNTSRADHKPENRVKPGGKAI